MRADHPTLPARARAGAARAALALALAGALALGAAAGFLARSALDRADDAGAPDGAAAQLWTCGMHPQVLRDGPGTCPICNMALTPVSGNGAAHAGAGGDEALLIDPSVVQNMGLRLAPVEEAPLVRRIRAFGALVEPEPARHDVTLRTGGFVEKLHADTEGSWIERGDPLADLYSPELLIAVEELIGARKLLAGASGLDLRPLYDAAAEKLELYGLLPEQVGELAALDRAPRTLTLASPASGYLVDKPVNPGSFAPAGSLLVRLAETSKLWLDARLYDEDLPHVRVGQRATAVIDGAPGEPRAAEVVRVLPRIDPATRTGTVRLELDNADLALRAGMFATASFEVEIAPRAVVVPREAVIDTGERQMAFVALGGGHFEPRTLTVGAAGDGGLVQVLAGLAPGEQVVVSGQFLLDAESRIHEAVRRFLHDHPPVDGGAR